MIIRLGQLEPFNVPPVDNDEAALFMEHLTGDETFDFDGNQAPRALMIDHLKYAYPRLSSAHGFLLSIDIDTFQSLCNSNQFTTMKPILDATIIGTLGIDFGGDLIAPKLYATEYDFAPDDEGELSLIGGARGAKASTVTDNQIRDSLPETSSEDLSSESNQEDSSSDLSIKEPVTTPISKLRQYVITLFFILLVMGGGFFLYQKHATKMAIPKQATKPAIPNAIFTVKIIKKNNINIRKRPSSTADIIRTINVGKGSSFRAVEKNGDWYRIIYQADGKDDIGWIHKSLVAPVKDTKK